MRSAHITLRMSLLGGDLQSSCTICFFGVDACSVLLETIVGPSMVFLCRKHKRRPVVSSSVYIRVVFNKKTDPFDVTVLGSLMNW